MKFRQAKKVMCREIEENVFYRESTSRKADARIRREFQSPPTQLNIPAILERIFAVETD